MSANTISMEKARKELQRRPIKLERGELHNYADEAEQLIKDVVYVRGQSLVRIGAAVDLAAENWKAVKRADEQPVIVPVNVEYLRRKLNSLAEFQKYSSKSKNWIAIDCPKELASNILHAGDSRHFRPLVSISTAPFLRADLTVCDTPGYDRATGVYFSPNGEFPSVPSHPSKADAMAALERLMGPFKQFPYSAGAKAAFLSHILAAAGRHAFDTMPSYVYSAPVAASGKTLLSQMPGLIANGVAPAAHPYSDDSEEMRKVLMSALLAGDPIILFDNVPNGAKVRSPILCGFVTATEYSDRKLGASESPRLPNRCGVVLTGNNITPAGDFARRCIVCRLDANAETARGRVFEIPDLLTYVRAHRGQLIVDALTIITAFAKHTEICELPRPLESFEGWSRVARDPLVWLSVEDAVSTQQLETEDDVFPLREAFKQLALYEAFSPGREFAARDVARIATGCGGEQLKSALEGAGCADAASATRVGYWMRANRDRVADGVKLVQSGNHSGSARWRLSQMERVPSGGDGWD